MMVTGLFLRHDEVYRCWPWGRSTGKNGDEMTTLVAFWHFGLAMLFLHHPRKCSMLRLSWLWSETSSWPTRTTATSTSSSASRSGNAALSSWWLTNSYFWFDRARLLLMDNDPKFALKDIEKVLLHRYILFFTFSEKGSLAQISLLVIFLFEQVLVTQPNDFHAICTHAKVIYQVVHRSIHWV